MAANPETIGAGGSAPHAISAAVGFVALTIWPVAAARRGEAVPWGLRLTVSVAAAVVIAAFFGWFTVELIAAGRQLGLAERVLGEVQPLWPMTVVLSCRVSEHRS